MIIFSPCFSQYSSRSGTRAIVPSSFMTSQITPDGLSPASRARSTPASVWPVRSSTPPSFAFSGKMCPGWTRSCGRELGSIATWTVCARSCAEMPVVTPSRASIETVNAVWNGDSFFAAIRSRPSSSQRSPVSARQIRPRPCVAMKLIASGVQNCAAIVRSPSFSRSSASQTTTILPSRMSSIASSIVLNGGFVMSSSFSTYLASTSTSRFTARPGAAAPSVVRSSVSGMSDTSNACVVHARNGKRHAVDGDRALLDHVAQQLRRGARSRTTREKPSSRTDSTVPVPSTWPCTMCPPRRSPARSGSSTFTSSPSPSGASEVRRSVSAITSAANDPPFGSTAVRQTPFTAIESPGASSVASGVSTSRRPSRESREPLPCRLRAR